MSHLDKYIKQHNAWDAIFSKGPIVKPTNMQEAKPLFEKLAGELSPENLTCDGELSQSAVMAKRRFLDGVWSDLETIVDRKITESLIYSSRW